MAQYIEYLTEFNFISMVVRLFLAMITGGLIGFGREKKRRPAGFRTYMLVAIGAALAVILSQYMDYLLNNDWLNVSSAVGIKTDVSRFGAQVINGVGFLGAGTIIVTWRHEVKGITTAAGLWASACMGLAVGAGFYVCVFIGFLLITLCMNVLPLIEDAVLANSRNMTVFVEMDNIAGVGAIAAKLKAASCQIFDTQLNKQERGNFTQINVVFNLRLPKKRQHTEVLTMLSTFDGIITIEEI